MNKWNYYREGKSISPWCCITHKKETIISFPWPGPSVWRTPYKSEKKEIIIKVLRLNPSRRISICLLIKYVPLDWSSLKELPLPFYLCLFRTITSSGFNSTARRYGRCRRGRRSLRIHRYPRKKRETIISIPENKRFINQLPSRR